LLFALREDCISGATFCSSHVRAFASLCRVACGVPVMQLIGRHLDGCFGVLLTLNGRLAGAGGGRFAGRSAVQYRLLPHFLSGVTTMAAGGRGNDGGGKTAMGSGMLNGRHEGGVTALSSVAYCHAHCTPATTGLFLRLRWKRAGRHALLFPFPVSPAAVIQPQHCAACRGGCLLFVF